jgi:hypothetical protein
MKEAIDSIDAIIGEADAVMVARGDLGVCGGATTQPIVMKLAEFEQFQTVIIFIKCGVNWSFRFCFIDSRKSPFHIHLMNSRYNSFALPCSCLIKSISYQWSR